jgi:Protein of unknown function (DUF2946)
MTSASNLTACCADDTIAQGSNRQAMTLLRGKRLRGWVAVLLPILLLRALIPVGFMPMVGADHSVRLVICDSYAPVPTSMMDMAMDGADGSGGPPVHQQHGSCPYGASPALGALPALAFLPLVFHRPATIVVAAPRVDFHPALYRAQSPRGPPA